MVSKEGFLIMIVDDFGIVDILQRDRKISKETVGGTTARLF